MRSRAAWSAGRPRISMLPASVPRMFMTMRSVVVLPAPFGPSSPKTEPLGISRLRSLTATWPANVLRTPDRRRAAAFTGTYTIRRNGAERSARLYSRPLMRAEARGSLLVLLSAAAYGAMPILARLAYADGVSVAALLAYRFLFATLLFLLLRRRRAVALPPRRRLLLWGLGALFLGNALCYFLALQRVPVSVMTLLVYTYPVMVTLLSAAAGLEPLTPRNLGAAGLAFGGGALTAGSVASADPLGVALALATAVIYSLYMVLAHRFARDASSEDAALHVSQVAVAAYAAWAAARGELLLHTTPRAWLALFLIGAVCTVLALRGFLAGLALVGPSRASVLSSFELIVAVALAMLVLGERPGPTVLVGGLLIVAAAALQRPALR